MSCIWFPGHIDKRYSIYPTPTAEGSALARPANGWIFPSGAAEGHFNDNAGKDQHKKALGDSGVERFEPYVLRHTALTRLAAAGADAHTLARIAGHSSIVITMRYVHPQADAIERAFAMANGQLAARPANRPKRLGTKLGTPKNSAPQPVCSKS